MGPVVPLRHRANVTTRFNPMKLTTTTTQNLAGADLSVEAKEYCYISSYGEVSFRSASGCSVSVKTDPRLLSEAVQGYVSSLRHLSDPDRVRLAKLTLEGLEAAVATAKEALAS